jgi:hypothetical protein
MSSSSVSSSELKLRETKRQISAAIVRRSEEKVLFYQRLADKQAEEVQQESVCATASGVIEEDTPAVPIPQTLAGFLGGTWRRVYLRPTECLWDRECGNDEADWFYAVESAPGLWTFEFGRA